MKVKNESEVAQSYPIPSDPRTAAYQAPPFMGFFQETPRLSKLKICGQLSYAVDMR